MYTLETGNESSSDKDLLWKRKDIFLNPKTNRMNKKHSKSAVIRQIGSYMNA